MEDNHGVEGDGAGCIAVVQGFPKRRTRGIYCPVP